MVYKKPKSKKHKTTKRTVGGISAKRRKEMMAQGAMAREMAEDIYHTSRTGATLMYGVAKKHITKENIQKAKSFFSSLFGKKKKEQGNGKRITMSIMR